MNYEMNIHTPLVRSTIDTLEAADIDYCIFSGVHAALLGGHRTTPDVDFWVDHTKWDELVGVFPPGSVTDRRQTWRPGDPYDGVLVTLGEQHEVGVMAGTIIHADGVTYPSSFTELVRSHRQFRELGGLATWFANPADTLLFKAISQRGSDQGKNDISDIVAIHQAEPIDQAYLLQRIDECNAAARVLPLLQRLGVLPLSSM